MDLAGGIALTVVWSRDLPADPSSVRVYQDNIGHWYASFVVPAVVDPLSETGAVIGIDWGVKDIATTTSQAHDLPHAGRIQILRAQPTGSVPPSSTYRAVAGGHRSRVRTARTTLYSGLLRPVPSHAVSRTCPRPAP